MKIDLNVLDYTEKIIYALRTLYMKQGYQRYKMSKFEEYDLYSRNKSFLVSDEIITFTDIDGKLMALKPDVTLSIIKNTRNDGSTRKLCYNENVYRVAGGVRMFREIMQTGIECIGSVSEAEISEVLDLAAESLKTLSDSYLLEISDLDLLLSFVGALGLDKQKEDCVLELMRAKNLHECEEFCRASCADEKAAKALLELMTISARPSEAFKRLEALCEKDDAKQRLSSLKNALKMLTEKKLDDHIRIDFSLAGNMHYYNGLVFRGYIDGIPEGVLSGGQYDRLMKRLGSDSKAIGFAVYLDKLERLEGARKGGETQC